MWELSSQPLRPANAEGVAPSAFAVEGARAPVVGPDRQVVGLRRRLVEEAAQLEDTRLSLWNSIRELPFLR